MRQVNISYLKNNLSAVLAKLCRTKNAVQVLDRNQAIAIIHAYDPSGLESDSSELLSALEEQELIEVGKKKISEDFYKTRRPAAPKGLDVVKILLENRD